jgi:hypothetical protein
MKTTATTSADFEIIFDNAGGATLQNHDGTVAINYSDMQQLARDVRELDNGDDAIGWYGLDANLYISDEEYEKHASSGGYFALQLDPDYRAGWPDADETGWNNVAEFIRSFLA